METIGSDSTAAETQLRLQDIEPRFYETISLAAERVVQETEDPEHIIAARRARNRIVELARAAFNNSDPFVAGADAWALALQLERYYSTSPGRQELGDDAGIMGEAARSLGDDIETTLIVGLGDEELVGRGRESVHGWANAHPMRAPGLQRDSFLSALPETDYDSLSLPGTVQDVARSLADMRHQMNVRLAAFPADLKWELHVLIDEALHDPRMGKMLADVDAVGEVSNTINDFIHGTPALIASERNRLLGAVRQEREIVLTAVDGQRVDTLDRLTAERVAVLEAITGERIAVSESLREERVAATSDAERIADELVDRGAERAIEVVDHFFPRLAMLGGLFFVGLFGYRAFSSWLTSRGG